MWTYRVGSEQAKRLLLTGVFEKTNYRLEILAGKLISGTEAAKIGLVGEACPNKELKERSEDLLHRITTVPSNQLFFQKLVVNNMVEMMVLCLFCCCFFVEKVLFLQGLATSQKLSTLLDGMTRHTLERVAFQEQCFKEGFKAVVAKRDAPNKKAKL